MKAIADKVSSLLSNTLMYWMPLRIIASELMLFLFDYSQD